MKLARVAAGAVWIGMAAGAVAQAEKRPLDHDAYDIWNRITGQQISDDGRWVLYTIRPGDPEAEATLVVREVETERSFSAARGGSASFSECNGFVAYLVDPHPKVVEQEKKDKVPADRQSKKTLAILNLSTGETTRIDRVRSFSMPAEAGGLIAYHLEKPLPPEKQAEKPDEAAPEAKAEEPPTKAPAPEPTAGEPAQPPRGERPEDPKKKEKKKDPGTELVLRALGSGEEHRFADVTAHEFSRDGTLLALAISSEAAEEDGVLVVETATGGASRVASGRGHYKSLAFDEGGARLAFLTDRDDYEADEPSWSVMVWERDAERATVAAGADSDGIPGGWWVSDRQGPSFSRSGERLFFSTAPRPAPKAETKPEESDEPKVTLDVWHWRDPQLQPQQLRNASREKSRTYRAVVHRDGSIVQIETPDHQSVTVGSRGDADVGLCNDDRPYRIMDSWESPGFNDVYLVDVRTGERERILTRLRGSASLSPGSRYVAWWDYDERRWRAMSVRTRETIDLTGGIGVPLYDELDDTPAPPRPHGVAGWTAGDGAVLVYDRFDIWAIDPSGFWPPKCVTEGYGRRHDIRLRVVRLDREEDWIDADAPLHLSAFHVRTKASGAYRDRVRGDAEPMRLVMLDAQLGAPRRADDADVLLYTRETFREAANLWASDLDYSRPRRLTDANPQQADYRWGDAEIVEWTSLDGERLQGILYKPDGFDPSRRYPMLVYFYERSSDGLHAYHAPAPSSSSINRSFYVSRGYLVFVPDIPYKVGRPGQSCLSAVVPGIASLVDAGFVDERRIGVQGHSWGGYQIAYLVTQTDIFRAAEAGAPVSNMTSAYGGIRWGTGVSRMFQYENTQSRIGGSLWEAQPRYLENSPIFMADRIETPLLILHNDQDGAVPWQQGIELFVALRRLGRPCWMFNYNGEDHGLRQRHNQKDWAVRMQQFFDHYLLDAPPPVWLAEGVPAVEKGENLGLDLIESWTGDRPRVGEDRR